MGDHIPNLSTPAGVAWVEANLAHVSGEHARPRAKAVREAERAS